MKICQFWVSDPERQSVNVRGNVGILKSGKFELQMQIFMVIG